MIVGFTCGAFDLLHAGHLVMFSECKKHCDHLIVGLHVDPSYERIEKNTPIQSMYERYLQLKHSRDVDEIIPYQTEEDLENILAIENIQIIHTSRKHSYSSRTLREKIYDQSNIP